MADYGNIYGGAYYPLDEGYGFIGVRQKAGDFTLAIDPRTSNQLQEASGKLNMGAKSIEIQGTFAKTLDAIPKQHLEEIRRLSKLTGSSLSFHGPLVEPSGFDGQANRWDEANRRHSETQLAQAVERAHELDPEGNIVVTIHSTAALPELLQREKIGKEEKITSMFVVDDRTGRVSQVKETPRYFEQNIKGETYEFKPFEEVNKINKDVWDNQIGEIARQAEIATSNLPTGEEPKGVSELKRQLRNGEITKEEIQQQNPELLPLVMSGDRESYARVLLRNSYDQIKELYDAAYHAAKREGRKDDLHKLEQFSKGLSGETFEKLKELDLDTLNKVVHQGIDLLEDINQKQPLKLFRPFNDFVVEKSSQTFANVALNSYNKFGSNSPIISIENPPAGSGLSRAEDLKKLIESSRKIFEDTLVEKEGKGRDEARKIAEKVIGATWDVGHINMIRKFGYGKEDTIKEAEKIAPYLKHIHLSDNFGMEHTELPMGMGNVATKEIFEKFKDKVNKVNKVVEVGDWWQHFKASPLADTFAAFGSPVTSGGSGYWNTNFNRYGNYFGGYGTTLPEQHFSLYGGGFSGLPTELGGQIPGKNSRATGGTPLA